MSRTRAVHHRGAAVLLDRLSDKTRVEGSRRGLDLFLPAPRRRLGLAHETPVGRGKIAIAKQVPWAGHATVEIRGGRARPVLAKEWLDHREGVDDPRQQRVARLGIADRELQHVREPPRAVVAQEGHPSAEGAGHAGGDQAGPWDLREPHFADVRDGRMCRRRPLAGDHFRALARGVPQEDRHLAAETIEMRFDDLEHEPGGARRIEGVAAAIEHRHRALGGEPVRRADDTERALDLRPSGESHRTQKASCKPPRRAQFSSSRNSR